jgi:regulator of sigma E protease
MQTLLITILTLGVLVTFHEFGHFWVARRCGVKVLRFCVGFGKPFWSWRDRSGTEFAIAAIPLGGYVKLLDEREGEVPPELLSQSFNRKPVAQRIAVYAAGPLANFLLALILYYALIVTIGVGGISPLIGGVTPNSPAERAGLAAGEEIVALDGEPTPTRRALHERLVGHIGDTGTLRISVKAAGTGAVRETTATLDRWLAGETDPDLIGGLGIQLWEPQVPAVAAKIAPDSPAARAGLRAGDRIDSADGVAMPDVASWVHYVRARPQQAMAVVVVRGGERLPLELVPDRKVDDKGNAYGQVGMEFDTRVSWPPEMLRHFQYSPVAAVAAAGQRCWDMTVLSLQSIKKLALGEISPKNLSGPITIAKVATASAKAGWEYYVDFLAFFSISLGVLNLLPIPVLDGGHILFALPELLTGKPLSERVQAMGIQIGMFIIVGIMALALYNDLMRA